MRVLRFFYLFLIVFCLSSCISDFSKDTLDTLQTLKSEVISYTNTFESEDVDFAYGDQLRQKLVDFRNSESEKDKNKDSVKQIEEIIEIYDRNYLHRKNTGVWSENNKQLQIRILEKAFEIVIRSEKSKPGGDE